MITYDSSEAFFSNSDVRRRCTSAIQQTTVPLQEVKLLSSPMQVYIEDTDAYGVVYNANYIRSYERALYSFGKSNPGLSDFLSTDNWSIMKVNTQRFKKANRLGGRFLVTGMRKSVSQAEEIWEMEIIDETNGTVFNSALVSIGNELPYMPPITPSIKNLPTLDESFVLHRDEFDLHLSERIPLRNVMNPFERARSNSLGGPDILRQLQERDGKIFVVISIDEASLVRNDAALCGPGTEVIVRTSIQLKRRGIMQFFHTLCAEDSLGNYHRVAQAIVVLMTLDASTKQPTSIPEWMTKKFQCG
jgi:acyl-CoA thioester hydrolase